MVEVISHTLGFCGDSHPSLAAFLLETPQLNPIFTYIKTLFR
jgi:hypothetical protein